MSIDSIYIIGAGGHAKVIIAALMEKGLICKGIYDDNKLLWGRKILDTPIVGAVSELKDSSTDSAIIAIGNNNVRKKIGEKFTNIKWLSLIHPHAWVHKSVKIGEGTVVFAGAIIQPDTVIGRHSIINTSASVDHDCLIGDFCHIAPGSHIAGGVEIENEVFIGIASAVLPLVKITANTLIGAGTTVTKNIEAPGTYIGTPAKKVEI